MIDYLDFKGCGYFIKIGQKVKTKNVLASFNDFKLETTIDDNALCVCKRTQTRNSFVLN